MNEMQEENASATALIETLEKELKNANDNFKMYQSWYQEERDKNEKLQKTNKRLMIALDAVTTILKD